MSNTEMAPAELACPAGGPAERTVEVLAAREVPLGGPRAMKVRRTLPQRKRSLIGAWCFADQYGPEDVSAGAVMDVPPHPHTGLQTVTWLFAGEVEHRDSLGTHAMVRPGELNLMTAGDGICHSEVSTAGTGTLHGVQLWVALPDAHRRTRRDFQHYAPPPVEVGGATVRVFLGTLAGQTAPVRTFSPLLGAEIVLGPGARLTLPVDPGYEHGLLADTGTVEVAGTRLTAADLGFLAAGARTLKLVNLTLETARLLLLGGEPFTEDIVMWWNFVARSHDEIVDFRHAWENEAGQFGHVEGYAGLPRRLPAPALPNARIKPRKPPTPTQNP